LHLLVRLLTPALQAMAKFIQPEVLDGDNQYFCERCNKKVDALKGLKFTKFPYIICFQLKRFDFDYETVRPARVRSVGGVRVCVCVCVSLRALVVGSFSLVYADAAHQTE
jgi:ubiquitin C-terminal hydrolase